MRISRSALRLATRIVSLVLGPLLGAACGEIIGVSEDGVPRATYKLDGSVRAKATAGAIAGIRVFLERGDFRYGPDETRSDSTGRWVLELGTRPCGAACALWAVDLDGAENGGSFRAVRTPISSVRARSGRDRRDEGTFELRGIVIEMEPDSAAAPRPRTGEAP